MGHIWLLTSDGRQIHLPVVGDDVNSPDDPIKIPTSMIMNTNRCWSQPIVVNHPTYGSFTIDLMLDSGLTGSCNQCGQCCGHPIANCLHPADCGFVLHEDLQWHVCQYLDIKNWRKFGDAGNTTCTIYDTLLDMFKGCIYPPPIYAWMTNCGFTVI